MFQKVPIVTSDKETMEFIPANQNPNFSFLKEYTCCKILNHSSVGEKRGHPVIEIMKESPTYFDA